MNKADMGLRRIVQNYLPKSQGWLWTPIETGATQAGVPDSFWAHEPSRTHGWIEHKATAGWAVTVRPHQVAWMELHAAAGVPCVFLIRAGGTAASKGHGDSLWAVQGAAARFLSEVGLGDLPGSAILGYWPGGPPQWNWQRLAKLLTNGQ